MTNLKLDKLPNKDSKFRTEEEREINIGKNLLRLIPTKPKKFLGIKINDKFYPLTEDQIKQIIIGNNLASENYNEAVGELVQGCYKLRTNPTERLKFKELRNNGDTLYEPFISWFDGF